MRWDFENAPLHYNSNSVPLDEAILRLSIENPGYFLLPSILRRRLDSPVLEHIANAPRCMMFDLKSGGE
jgi:hypothetical protein